MLALAPLAGACADPATRALEKARKNGRRDYLAYCVPCHGELGNGQGERSKDLDPKPRNYTDPVWRASATEESVFAAISNGVPGSAMPDWSLLSEDKIHDLTTYVLSIAAMGPRVRGVDPEPRD